MKRYVLAVAVAASFVLPAAPALADHCGDTLQPPCETCVPFVDFTDRPIVCVPIDVQHG